VTVLSNFIYAMGGFDGYVRLNTAERYEPETNQWTLIAPMHEQRSDASATTLYGKVKNQSGRGSRKDQHGNETVLPFGGEAGKQNGFQYKLCRTFVFSIHRRLGPGPTVDTKIQMLKSVI
jgi:hypothetical protein